MKGQDPLQWIVGAKTCKKDTSNRPAKVKDQKETEDLPIQKGQIQKRIIYTYLQQKRRTTGKTSSLDEAAVYVLSISGGSKGYWVSPLLDGKPIHMELDIGAAVSLVSETVNKETLNNLPLQPANITLKTFTRERSWMKKIWLHWTAIQMLSSEDVNLTTVLDKHADFFKDELRSMKGRPVKLNIKPGSNPRFLKSKPVSYAIRPGGSWTAIPG